MSHSWSSSGLMKFFVLVFFFNGVGALLAALFGGIIVFVFQKLVITLPATGTRVDSTFAGLSWDVSMWELLGALAAGWVFTLWLGSCGASTPLHYDSYGLNFVAQCIGTKLWRLAPPSDPRADGVEQSGRAEKSGTSLR